MAEAVKRAPSTRPRNSEATRTDLLHAAMRRFTVLGYERTTARDVAADAGVNVSLINRYFGSKDGLFAAVMQESADAQEQFRTNHAERLVDSMLGQLEPGLWPEFGGEHPLLLLLREVGEDQRVGDLRRRSLDTVIRKLVDQADPDPSSRPPDVRLHAELVLALVAGVLTLRAALPDSELATTDGQRLREALERVTAAILNPP
jgi:AcrR family transcriptional regulator